MEELWKPIKNFNGYYEISNLGRVRNTLTGHIKKPSKKRTGYWKVCLSVKGVHKTESIHRLVATHFIPNPHNLPEVDHLKGKDYNTVDDLEWVDKSKNCRRYHQSRAHNPINSQAVHCYNLSGDYLDSFASQKIAAKSLGINRISITRCLQGKRHQCKGLRFSRIKLKKLSPL